MKRFVFEVTIEESDVDGDEYWEEALERDGSGIATLKETLEDALVEAFFINYKDEDEEKDFRERIILKKYSN
jgi:hypothetical protein